MFPATLFSKIHGVLHNVWLLYYLNIDCQVSQWDHICNTIRCHLFGYQCGDTCCSLHDLPWRYVQWYWYHSTLLITNLFFRFICHCQYQFRLWIWTKAALWANHYWYVWFFFNSTSAQDPTPYILQGYLSLQASNLYALRTYPAHSQSM